MSDLNPDSREPGLLRPDGAWNFYESDHEVEKYVRRVGEFVLPLLARLHASRVLEVGCGSGRGTVFLREQGLDAWGIDPHFRADIFASHPYLVVGSGEDLPFDTDSFDVVFSLEVIEHVGTVDGFLTPAPDCWARRQQFVSEVCRVAERSVIVATPNKRFPVDEHASDSSGSHGFRIHSPFEQATLSAGELQRLFRTGGFRLGQFIDPAGYYALERVRRKLGPVGVAAARSVLRLSTVPVISRSPLNPHLFLRFDRDE